jgi:hypothetical protein
MRRTVVVLGITVMALAGCGKETPEDIADSLKDKGTMDVLEEAGKDSYDPPADGKLTEKQIEMYLQVREREVEIAKVARQQLEDQAAKVKEKGEKSLSGLMEAYKGLGSAADFLTADVRAAQELGHNTAEYMWVKGQVIKASAAEYTEKAQAQLSNMADQAYTNLRKQYDEATDENTKEMLRKALDNMEESRAKFDEERAETDEAGVYNRQLLSKYEDTLKALATEATKWNEDHQSADEMTDSLRKSLETTTSTSQEQ